MVGPTTASRVCFLFSRCSHRSDISGAAIFHSGYLGLFFTVFAGNTAGEDGTAVFSIGVVEQAANVTFDSNTLSCPQGDYGYDREVRVPKETLVYTGAYLYSQRRALDASPDRASIAPVSRGLQ